MRLGNMVDARFLFFSDPSSDIQKKYRSARICNFPSQLLAIDLSATRVNLILHINNCIRDLSQVSLVAKAATFIFIRMTSLRIVKSKLNLGLMINIQYRLEGQKTF